jgi:(2Fe-2S) ferredoxin
MLLDAETFMRIKAEFVDQTLKRLRDLARSEALLLVNEQQLHPLTPLPEISIRLSRIVNSVDDAIEDALPSWSEDDLELAWALVREHLPAILLEEGGSRIRKALPPSYISRLIASRLAAGIVYREGISFFASMEPDAIMEIARSYLRKDREITRLVELVEKSGMPESPRIAELLRRGGTRASLQDM